MTSKLNKGIGIIMKLRVILTIYKSFIRPNVGYCDFVYNQPHNDHESFYNNVEKLQLIAAFTIIGAI